MFPYVMIAVMPIFCSADWPMKFLSRLPFTRHWMDYQASPSPSLDCIYSENRDGRKRREENKDKENKGNKDKESNNDEENRINRNNDIRNNDQENKNQVRVQVKKDCFLKPL